MSFRTRSLSGKDFVHRPGSPERETFYAQRCPANAGVRGKAFFMSLYGETGDNVQGLLDKISPDMGMLPIAPLRDKASIDWSHRIDMFSQNIAYGHVYGSLEVTNQLETAYRLLGTLIAGDTPRQINWHLDNARRSGAS